MYLVGEGGVHQLDNVHGALQRVAERLGFKLLMKSIEVSIG